MLSLITVIHILAALLLILLVLIQDSKGAMGSSFGGGATNSILGPTGAPSFLFKMTKYTVIVFAITSIALTKFTTKDADSVISREAAPVSSEMVKDVENVQTKDASEATTKEKPSENPKK